ncbi:MAG: hypothetical protein ACRDQ5_08805, partial [Sciscionella sp.]
MGTRRIDGVLFVVIPGAGDTGRLRRLDGGGGADEASEHAPDLAARIGELECAHHPRWVWPSTAQVYPPLLQAGVRVRRCHDISA